MDEVGEVEIRWEIGGRGGGGGGSEGATKLDLNISQDSLHVCI